ncbi:MAG: hypothetical protein GY820_15830 [Gammaproteobacteria bacterium]|nr:hypothetical protein [Gammaproteobacteria bacterium]
MASFHAEKKAHLPLKVVVVTQQFMQCSAVDGSQISVTRVQIRENTSLLKERRLKDIMLACLKGVQHQQQQHHHHSHGMLLTTPHGHHGNGIMAQADLWQAGVASNSTHMDGWMMLEIL